MPIQNDFDFVIIRYHSTRGHPYPLHPHNNRLIINVFTTLMFRFATEIISIRITMHQTDCHRSVTIDSGQNSLYVRSEGFIKNFLRNANDPRTSICVANAIGSIVAK